MSIKKNQQVLAHSELASVIQKAVKFDNDISEDEVLKKLLTSVRDHFGMEVSFISKFENGRRYFQHVDQKENLNLLSVNDSDDLDFSFCQRVTDGRFPQVINDAQKMEICKELEVTCNLPVGAHLSVPIRLSDNSVYGTMCCFDRDANDSLNERDAAFLRTIADITGHFLENSVNKSKNKKEITERISSALTSDVMSMVHQPIIDIRKRVVVGYEALCRFNTSEYRGPDIWFNEAKDVELEVPLEHRALALALADLIFFKNRTKADGPLEYRVLGLGLVDLEYCKNSIYMGCNISPKAILNPGFDTLLAGIPLEQIVLEITEHELVSDYQHINERLKPFRERGLRVAVDDAGAGYASFQHILQINPDYVKLDMSLVRDIDSHPGKRSLVAAFVYFAGETNSVLVAEGVETMQELETLDALGVHKAQGYLIGKPAKL